jgi:phosphoribosylaminoimidazole-succinocarboxamide synthase
MGIDGAVNAALLSIEMLAVSDAVSRRQRLEEKRREAGSGKGPGQADAAVEEKFNTICGIKKEEQPWKKETALRGQSQERFSPPKTPLLVIVSYKDDATALNGLKKGHHRRQGRHQQPDDEQLLMQMLEKKGVPTHFVKELNDRETLVKKVSIVPLEVIIRNVSAGHFAKRYGVEEGIEFETPTIEFSYKNDELHDPLLNEYHALALKLATREEIDAIKKMAFKTNDILKEYFASLGVRSHRLQARVRQNRRRTARAGGRDLPGHLPLLGRQDERESWTRTASAATWAASRTPTRK